jgi:hypothetical protein
MCYTSLICFKECGTPEHPKTQFRLGNIGIVTERVDESVAQEYMARNGVSKMENTEANA